MTPPLTVDANVWVAAFDGTDRFNADSATFLRQLADRGIVPLAPAIFVLEVACALARRFADPALGREVGAKLTEPGVLLLEPLGEHLLAEALRLGTGRRLRAADALYAATAALGSGGSLVSWDAELIERAGAITPSTWLAAD